MFESDAGSAMPSLANVNGPSAVANSSDLLRAAAVSRKVIMCWWFKLVMLELDDDHSNVDQSLKTCIGTAMREVEQPSHLQQSQACVCIGSVKLRKHPSHKTHLWLSPD